MEPTGRRKAPPDDRLPEIRVLDVAFVLRIALRSIRATHLGSAQISGRAHRGQELADLEFELIAFARQRAGKTMDLFRRRSGVRRTAADICNTVANLNRTLRGQLDVARNFLCR